MNYRTCVDNFMTKKYIRSGTDIASQIRDQDKKYLRI